MMSRKVECIGGPADGKIICILSQARFIAVPTRWNGGFGMFQYKIYRTRTAAGTLYEIAASTKAEADTLMVKRNLKLEH